MQAQTTRDHAYGTLREALADKLARNPEGVSLGLLVIRVEELGKLITASGFTAVEELMAQLERDLRTALRANDQLIRLADDKLAAIMTNLRNQGHLSLAANKLMRICDARLRSPPRIGMALVAGAGGDADQLIHAAEAALQLADDRHEPCQMYDPVLSARATASWATRTELEDALENNQLDVYFQPKISAVDRTIVGAEALMRWFRGPGTSVSPEVFVALADRNGLIDKLTWHALTVAVRQAADWNREFGAFEIAVNVTPNVIEHHDMAALTANAIGLWGIAPEHLTIELTESALMQNPAQSHAVLRDLRSAGIKIALDDFGTGYSSLAYFKNIPADELKIDKSFVLNMHNDSTDRQLVQTIIALAHSFGLTVTAEGVENTETANLLSEMGCDYLQGFCFSKAVPAASLTAQLEASRSAAAVNDTDPHDPPRRVSNTP
jgi:EAL domain-containing protein (putative c-di-GMP-specific phosphodiesterase class I)/GGDEF domain-containing protein